MHTTLFYFTGTGNSLFLARELAEILDAEIIPIAPFKSYEENIIDKGGHLDARYAVHMPQNAFKKFWENPVTISGKAHKKLSKIAVRIRKKSTKRMVSDAFFAALLSPLNKKFTTLSAEWTAKNSKMPIDSDWDKLVHNNDKSFTISEKCLACYAYCPQEAIEDGIVRKGFKYHHPLMKATVIMKQKSCI